MKQLVRTAFALAMAAAVALALLWPNDADAQLRQFRGAVVTGTQIAVVLKTSGLELEAPATGRGIYVFLITSPTAIGVTISDSSILDADLADISPRAIFGAGEGTLTAFVRTGSDNAADGVHGTTPSAGDWLLNAPVAGNVVLGAETLSYSYLHEPLFVPPGSFFTVRRTVQNAALDVTVGFYEAWLL